MEEFFSYNPTEKFEVFSLSHIATMIFGLIVWIVTILIMKRVKNKKSKRIFEYSVAAILLGQYIAWIIWQIVGGVYSLKNGLPLQICEMGNLLCVILLITKSRNLYEVLYFWGIGGAIQAYITPDIISPFLHFEYILFYIQHIGIILVILYMTFVDGYRPYPKSMLKFAVVTILYMGVIYLVNLLVDGNYMFLMGPTPNESIIDVLIKIFGQPPRHIIGLGIVATITVLILYCPWFIKDLLNKKKEKKEA